MAGEVSGEQASHVAVSDRGHFLELGACLNLSILVNKLARQ